MLIRQLSYIALIAVAFAHTAEVIKADSGKYSALDALELQFVSWMAEFNRTYSSPAEYAHRLANYKANWEIVKSHNSKKSSYKLGMNKFADWSPEEYLMMLGGASETQSWKGKLKAQMMRLSSYFQKLFSYGPYTTKTELKLNHSYDDLPKKVVDWVAAGALNPIRDQRRCGSCWAFAAVAATEAAYFIKYNKKIELSEQHIVDCSIPSEFTISGCSGGFADGPSDYILKYGLQLASDFPYRGSEFDCQPPKSDPIIPSRVAKSHFTAYELLKEIAEGPVAVYVEVNADFMLYENGTFEINYPCGFVMNHAVTAVGYDLTSNPPIIKIRNSHGTTWGESGYGRFALSGPNDAVLCGLSGENTYRPIFDK